MNSGMNESIGSQSTDVRSVDVSTGYGYICFRQKDVVCTGRKQSGVAECEQL